MNIVTTEAIKEIASKIGDDKLDDRKPTRIAYRFTHGPEMLLHENLDDFTPGVVVWPESVEDVQKILKVAKEREIPVVTQAGRTSSHDAEGKHGCIALNLARMNKITDFNPKARRITAEAGIHVLDLGEYASKRGYMLLELPTMEKVAQLGSRAAVHGYNKYEMRWGSSGNNIKGLEVVLANGDVVQVGTGSRVPTKNVMGYNLMGLFMGSRGTLGIVTKVTENMIEPPKSYKFGNLAFKTLRDGLETYIEWKKAADNIGPIWRTKFYSKRMLKTAVKGMIGQEWPEEIEGLVDYHILGEESVVKATEKVLLEIGKSYGGHWKEKYPPPNFITRVHTSIEQYIGMVSMETDRDKNGGECRRMIPFDASIPDGNVVEFYEDILEHWQRIENPKIYPHLVKVHKVLSDGSMIPVQGGFSKFWAMGLGASHYEWEADAREEFLSSIREYAEICWKHGGSMTSTHGFIPDALRFELIRREVGENEYRLMEEVKDLLDPKHILNPNIKFEGK